MNECKNMWVEVGLPLLVRTTKFMKSTPKCPEELKLVLQQAYIDFVDSYTPDGTTVLGIFQNGVKLYLKGKELNSWYVEIAVESLAYRRMDLDECKSVKQDFKGFSKHFDTIMGIFDDLGAPELKYESPPEESTINDLVHQLSKDVANMMELASNGLIVDDDPNGAFGLIYDRLSLIENESLYYENGFFTKFSNRSLKVIQRGLAVARAYGLTIVGENPDNYIAILKTLR
jgi:hypothetical protein